MSKAVTYAVAARYRSARVVSRARAEPAGKPAA